MFWTARSRTACALAFAALICLTAGTAPAGDETPPGFMPATLETPLTWPTADAKCKALGGYLPTAAQLQDIADATGDGSWKNHGWPAKAFWTRESLPVEGKGGLVRQYYAVPMETGKMELYADDRLNAAICAKGAGMDRKAKAIAGVAAKLAPVTMTWTDADRYCKARGKELPGVEALKSVADQSGNGAYAAHNWPKGMFWTREAGDGGHMLVNLGMGKEMAFPDDSLQWAVCAE